MQGEEGIFTSSGMGRRRALSHQRSTLVLPWTRASVGKKGASVWWLLMSMPTRPWASKAVRDNFLISPEGGKRLFCSRALGTPEGGDASTDGREGGAKLGGVPT